MASRSQWGKRSGPPPAGKIRQSQVVTTFGPGAMVDLVDDAVLIGGLDYWSSDRQHILEPRLRDILAERLRAQEIELAIDSAFQQPPAGDDAAPSKHCGIRVLEFPHWFVCQNPGCRALVRKNGLEFKSGRYRHHCISGGPQRCVPVRFVGACKNGHLEDFPWIRFVHDRQKACSGPLRLLEGATGDFSEVIVSCACGAKRRLSDALVRQQNPKCAGERPWLGPDAREECGEHLRLLVRTASNGYFAQIVSALSVPDKARELSDSVQKVFDVLNAATPETLGAFRQIPKVRQAIHDYSDEDVLAAVKSLKSDSPVVREPLRTAEFRQFIAAKPERPGDMPQPEDDFFVRSHVPEEGLPETVSQIILAHKLSEVRAQIGFTRLESSSPNLEGEYDLGVQSAALSIAADWLPATQIHGEGVFIRFDEDAVRKWQARPAVQKREQVLAAGYKTSIIGNDNAPEHPRPVRFYMLHSLAHMLMSAISLECGYAASAIRERIYCTYPDAETPMAAILLSTGSAGSEGTLGGLVDQGRQLRSHLRRAWEGGRLCSNDPVCASHSPENDYSERYLEGAACHGCLFVAECSCECFNHYLDRALVVPTIGNDPELAFFRERP